MSSAPSATDRMFTRVVQVLLAAAGAAVAAALAARSAAQELSQFQQDRLTLAVLCGSLAATAVFWCAAAVWGRRLIAGVGLSGLTTIALVAGLQFAAMFVSRMAGTGVDLVAGPFGVFINGLGDNGVPCLLTAVVVVLLPRAGAALLLLVTVWLLNVVATGSIGLTSLIFISTTVVLHEGLLAAAGVTVGPALKRPGAAAPWGCVLRVAASIALAKACVVYAQYALYVSLLRLQYAQAFMLAAAVVTGLLYGGAGAALGAVLGYRLRRTAA